MEGSELMKLNMEVRFMKDDIVHSSCPFSVELDSTDHIQLDNRSWFPLLLDAY